MTGQRAKYFILSSFIILGIFLLLYMLNNKEINYTSDHIKLSNSQNTSDLIENIPENPSEQLILEKNNVPKLQANVEDSDLKFFEDEVVNRAENMLDNSIHHGRLKLYNEMKEENLHETFDNIVKNDNFAMLMPVMNNVPFSPGEYNSDIRTVFKMARIRKLIEDSRNNPKESIAFLSTKLTLLEEQFDSQYDTFWKEFDEGMQQNTDELPDFMKTRLLAASAVYTISQLEAKDTIRALPVLARLSNIQSQKNERFRLVNQNMLFYCMHNIIKNVSEDNLTSQCKALRETYLNKVQHFNIPESRTKNVSAWNAYYDEDDYRKKILFQNIDLNNQPTIEIEQFPQIYDPAINGDFYFLLADLQKISDLL